MFVCVDAFCVCRRQLQDRSSVQHLIIAPTATTLPPHRQMRGSGELLTRTHTHTPQSGFVCVRHPGTAGSVGPHTHAEPFKVVV